MPIESQAELKNDLNPTAKRVLNTGDFFLMQIASAVNIGVFAIGSGLIGDINLTQAIVAIILGVFLGSIFKVLNGRAGHDHGIPFTIQLRSSFGTLGSKIPGLIRMIPALIWYGFQSWVGAEAINMILNIWFGFDYIFVAFVLFQAFHIALTYTGFEGIKWLENVGAIFIVFALGYMGYVVYQKYGIAVQDTVTGIKGNWGIPFIAGMIVFTGDAMNPAANSSDVTRNITKGMSQWKMFWLFFLGVAPVTLFMGIIGLVATGATGVADPISIFVEVFDNQFLLVVTLLFVIFSQVTTNVLNNALPITYVMMDLFKWSYGTAAIASGVIPLFLFPWKLVTPESAGGLNTFIKIFTVFLAPVITVMIVDYFVIRKTKLDMDLLYDAEGPYKGVNWAAIIAIAVGAVIGLFAQDVSWLVSSIPSGLVYYGLMKTMPSSKPFWAGTEQFSDNKL